MRPMLLAGVALMMLAGALPTTGYHLEGHGETSEATYVIGAAEVVTCESYGLTDPVNGAPAAHGGTDGLCFMSSNVGSCTAATPSQTDPLPADNCSYTVRPPGTFTTFHMVQTPLNPDVTATRTGNVYFTAHVGSLFALAGADGACVADNYADVAGSTHVEGIVPQKVVFG